MNTKYFLWFLITMALTAMSTIFMLLDRNKIDTAFQMRFIFGKNLNLTDTIVIDYPLKDPNMPFWFDQGRMAAMAIQMANDPHATFMGMTFDDPADIGKVIDTYTSLLYWYTVASIVVMLGCFAKLFIAEMTEDDTDADEDEETPMENKFALARKDIKERVDRLWYYNEKLNALHGRVKALTFRACEILNQKKLENAAQAQTKA